jgi:hypothetical protein
MPPVTQLARLSSSASIARLIQSRGSRMSLSTSATRSLVALLMP